MVKAALAFLILTAGLISGCAELARTPTSEYPASPLVGSHEASPLERPTSISTLTPDLQMEQPTVPLAAGVKGATERARADLAIRLRIDPKAIEVVRVTSEEFPAQNLGCPSSGKPATRPVQPALVTGWEIVLRSAGQEYAYRAHGGRVVFCEKTR